MKVDAPDIVDQAIAWHLRLDTASAEEWRDFVEWLEADQGHRDAYDQVSLDDALIPAVPATVPDMPIPANDDAPAPRRMRWWAAGGGGLAVAASLLVLLVGVHPSADGIRTIITAPGQTSRVRLDDGTLIELNGGTRLSLRPGDHRYAALEAGEATFHVRHDAAHPFELTSGRFTIRDAGTVFNVSRDGGRLGVEVAEGAVLFQPEAQAVKLAPGMGLSIRDGQARPIVHRVRAEQVGGWRRGLLDVRDMPIDAMAHAVSRSTGAAIRFTTPVGNRRFTGTLHLTDAPDVVIPRLAALIGARSEKVGGEWMLTIRSDGEP